ncbi:MAG: type I restriction enzyme HsdR N-terminal domain-containing protein [Vallitalea sp.]|jgi:superfamily I DNA/RNA helicase/SOS-response transcriptional repressor LexA|nr:type I restriction enzyme HsdR N-terminal domain-containing protein [Vallitalea sp.]
MILNIDQRRIVDSEVNGHMLIRGVAGSGKTTVAIARIPILLEYYCKEDDKVLLLTYNKTLINYISHLYNKMDFQSTLFDDNKKKLDIKTVDSIICKLFCKLGYKPNIPSTKDKYDALERVIINLGNKYGDIAWYNATNKQFLLNEIDWLISCGYDNIKSYQEADRLGRATQTKKSGGQGVQRINKNSRQREAIFETYQIYHIEMRKKKFYDFSDMAKIVCEQFDKINCQKYTHIIIDEAQDLSKRQLDVIRLLYNEKKYSSAIFITDTSQSIYEKSWLSYHPFTTIDFNMSGRARILSKNYRTTKQVAMAAYSLTEKDESITSNELYVEPQVVEREGSFPVYRHFDNDKEEYEYIVDRIKHLSKRYELKDMVVIARNNKQLELIKEYMISNGVDTKIYKDDVKFEDDIIKLFTMHSIKGLEFKVVFICGLNEGIIPYRSSCVAEDINNTEIQDRKLLYVGMTRAEEKLYLTSYGVASKFMNDINKHYLITNDDEPFGNIKKLPEVDYYFGEKLLEKHTKEEMIRQGIIHSLINELGYPINNVDIEVPVNRYSRTGYADIVIYKTYNKEKPLVVIETKAPNEEIKKHKQQLFDYMKGLPSVRFGMISNGKQHFFFEKIGNNILDRSCLPSYENLVNTIDKKYLFKNLINNKEFLYIVNGYDKMNISIKYVDEEGILPISKYENIDILGNISAGLFKVIQYNDKQECDRQIPLPKEWIQDSYRYMMLRADGDSMLNAGIDPGDYVLVRIQQSVDNYDIAIVIVDDAATMKKVVKMGEKIMLMADNSKYEPIIRYANEVFINGKVVGVLKLGI